MEKSLERYSSYLATLTNHVNQRVLIPIMGTEAQQNEPKKFLYSLLFKINNGLDSANLFILNVFNKPQFSDSLFIILRTLLSDVITLNYIFAKSKGSDLKLKEYIENVYYDHIKLMIKNIGIFQLLYNEKEGEINARKQKIIDLKNEFFDNSGNIKPHLKGLKSVSQMVREIACETDKENPLDYLIIAYEHYDIFSKYEHLGDLTFNLIHRSFRNDQKKRILSEIFHSVNVIIHYQKSLILAFYAKETDEYKVFCDLKGKIEKTNLMSL